MPGETKSGGDEEARIEVANYMLTAFALEDATMTAEIELCDALNSLLGKITDGQGYGHSGLSDDS